MLKNIFKILASAVFFAFCLHPLEAKDAQAGSASAKKFEGFECGMGIGGWLTNYKRFNVLPVERRMKITVGDFEHFDSYITEADVENIASMGFDHVRVGFDQIVLEESPYVYREKIFKLLENFVDWCQKRNMGVVLNLHKAVGNYCDIKEEIKLLDDAELQKRFIALWTAMEKRFAGNDLVVFELLNEVVNVDPKKWNDLAEKTLKSIRKLNPSRKVVIGSTNWNSASKLSDLKLYDDENVIYTFHFYEPFEFTHQQGVLQADPLYYNRKMEYPGDMEKYIEYKKLLGANYGSYEKFDRMDKRYLESCLKPAFDFVKNHPDKVLWCGEFGTIRHCDIRWRQNWMNDVISLLKEHGISYCVWNYLSTPNDGNRFSLVDDDTRKILSPRLLEILKGNVK